MDETVVLFIKFEGNITDDMVGFFRATYRPLDRAGGNAIEDIQKPEQIMLISQMQSSEARAVFPCFDEPNLKATFDISIEIPSDLTALSNMPVKLTESRALGFGLHKVTFETTPPMSTYLLIWAVSSFEYVERTVTREDGTAFPLRVYTTKGLSQYGASGLGLACDVVQYFAKA